MISPAKIEKKHSPRRLLDFFFQKKLFFYVFMKDAVYKYFIYLCSLNLIKEAEEAENPEKSRRCL